MSEALPGVLGKAFISGEQMQNFEGNRGTKTILWNREHKKTIFFIFGKQANLFQGNKGIGTHSWKGLISRW